MLASVVPPTQSTAATHVSDSNGRPPGWASVSRSMTSLAPRAWGEAGAPGAPGRGQRLAIEDLLGPEGGEVVVVAGLARAGHHLEGPLCQQVDGHAPDPA